MSAFLLMTTVYSITGNSEAADTPVVSFSPNWKKIFVYESVTITCNVQAPGAHWFYWYKDNRKLHTNNQSFTIEFADEMNAGNYQCKTNQTQRSRPAKMSVLGGWVILQAPLLICEGDVLFLKCHSFPGRNARNTTFSLDGKWLSFLEDKIQVGKLNGTGTETYKCRKEVYYNSRYHSHTDTTTVNVTELFSEPEIKVDPILPTVGTAVTLTCDLDLCPLRVDTELHFVFYKDGQKLREFGLSNKYQINTAGPADSGNYTCEAKTRDNHIKKTSKMVHLQIEKSLIFLASVLVAALLTILIPTVIIFNYRRHFPQLRGNFPLHFSDNPSCSSSAWKANLSSLMSSSCCMFGLRLPNSKGYRSWYPRHPFPLNQEVFVPTQRRRHKQ
uniref:Ig-like domain-containing protein n=1 Tax=Leptobrachium leishanense TaxID=445787 RepID=A0A8C5PES8_9ANUR